MVVICHRARIHKENYHSQYDAIYIHIGTVKGCHTRLMYGYCTKTDNYNDRMSGLHSIESSTIVQQGKRVV